METGGGIETVSCKLRMRLTAGESASLAFCKPQRRLTEEKSRSAAPKSVAVSSKGG